MLESNRDGTVGQMPGIVRGAVDRVDHPDIFPVGSADSFFLTDETATGKKRGKPFAQEVLHCKIGGGHDVLVSSFALDLEGICKHQARCLANRADD